MLIITFFILLLVLNVVICMVAQGLSLVDSLYLMVITLTTVGYGDIVPDYSSSIWQLLIFAFVAGTPRVLLRKVLNVEGHSEKF